MAEAKLSNTDKEITSSGLQHVPCGPCEVRFVQARATNWCTSCEEGLCADCFEYHKASKASRDHCTITVNEFEALKPFITSLTVQCDGHEFPVTLYCPNHEVPCCSTCAIENHSTCLGITSFQEFASKLRKSSYHEHLDTTTESFLKNVGSIIENRRANKDRLLKQADDRRAKLTKIRIEIISYLDALDRQLILKSDEFLKVEELCTGTILRSLEEKKNNVIQIRDHVLELRQTGSDVHVFYGSRKLVDTIKEEEDSLVSLFEGSDVMESSLEFSTDPMLRENISKLVDVYLKRDNSIVSLKTAVKPSCQIVSSDVSKIKAVLMTQYDASKFKTGTLTGYIAMMLSDEIIACDYSGCQLLVFTSDGNVKRVVETDNRPFGLAYLGKEQLAVSFPAISTIMILRTKDYSWENKIQLDASCWGLAFSDDLLAVAFNRTDILLLDVSGNIKKKLPMTRENLVYVHKHKQNLYRADYAESYVRCYNQVGETLWQWSSEAVGTRGMCTDTHGNLFVACQGSNRIEVISKDGKHHKTLLEIKKPKGICYDARKSIIYVCSCNGEYLSSYKLYS